METEGPHDQSSEGVLENKDKGTFYKDAADYWSQIPATVDGMLGGYGFISTVDINGSSLFLKQLFRLKVPPGKGRALDCGAGIGRITKNLLLNHFHKVDLVEQNPAFVAQARDALEMQKNMGTFFCSGLQDFIPERATYDVIWCQWVLGHLTDDDLLAFLSGCIYGLKDNGVIVLKENTTTSGRLEGDATDSSVTRPLNLLCQLLQQAGLRCVKQKRQENFPHGLYPVYMIATRPTCANAAMEANASALPTVQEPKITALSELERPTQCTLANYTQVEIAANVNLQTDQGVVKCSRGQTDLQDTLGPKLDQFELSEDASSVHNVVGHEDEECAFNCEVEYSTDDSTRTEASHPEPSYHSSKPSSEKTRSSLGENSKEPNDMKCDIF